MFSLLLVDGDADSRTLVAHALERGSPFQVVAETDRAGEAASLAAAHRPDITLLDPALGAPGGLWALRGVREAAPGTRVILRSTFGASELRFVALSGGAVGYLEKSRSPLTLADDLLAVCGLLDVVRAGIEGAKVHLGASNQAPSLARRFVTRALERWELQSELDVVELLVAELVTNSILHARSDVEVSVAILADRIRVAVLDSSREPPVRREPRLEDTSGRGLLMLDALAADWGMEFVPGGKSVWFEVRTDLRP